mgnify:CR=1 FL=1
MSEDAIRRELDNAMYINETDEESGQTPLHIACQFGNLKKLKTNFLSKCMYFHIHSIVVTMNFQKKWPQPPDWPQVPVELVKVAAVQRLV